MGGGVNQNLTHADRGEGGGPQKSDICWRGGEGGVQNGQKNADVINERPLISLSSHWYYYKLISKNIYEDICKFYIIIC